MQSSFFKIHVQDIFSMKMHRNVISYKFQSKVFLLTRNLLEFLLTLKHTMSCPLCT